LIVCYTKHFQEYSPTQKRRMYTTGSYGGCVPDCSWLFSVSQYFVNSHDT